MNKKLIIIVLIILAAAFYWFQIRPSNIRKKCYAYTLEKRDERINTEKPLNNSEANIFYRRCFAENGLKPEDIITK